MKNSQLEIACFNLESVIVAQNNGADRIELCENYLLGGVTPSYTLYEKVKEILKIDVYVMLRPRAGDFVYTDLEFLQLKNDLLYFKNAGAHGFVFGILDQNNQIDIRRNKELLELAYPLPCTFHRAFDEIEDVFLALSTLIACGFTNILSAGKAINAIEGVMLLKQLMDFAQQKINIIPGGGIRSSNIDILKENLNARFYHSAALNHLSDIAETIEVMALKNKLKN